MGVYAGTHPRRDAVIMILILSVLLCQNVFQARPELLFGLKAWIHDLVGLWH
jgi:hypothetical protein